jgi:response regulator RpfG family c-di-GMP phosphodiesterase
MSALPVSNRHCILIVDDEPGVLEALSLILDRPEYRVVCCSDGGQALLELDSTSFAAVISDQCMPGMSGLQLLGQVRVRQPDCSRILITGQIQVDTLIGAINLGEIFRFIAKPWTRGEVLATVENAVQRHVLQVENRRLQLETQSLNVRLTAANASLERSLEAFRQQKSFAERARGELMQNFEHSLGLCHRLLSTFYPLLGRQAQTVVEICRAMAATQHFTESQRHALMTSAWIYDLGLVAIDRALLHRLFTRPELCSPEERDLLQYHPVVGQSLAAFVDQSLEVGATIRSHHERYDGSGYPDGLAGESIPWTARCLAVAVAFVQSGRSNADACQYLQEQAGIGFDPEALRLFFKTSRMSDLPNNVTEVLLCELQSGMRLARGIVSPAGVLLVPEGQVLTEPSLKKLINHSRHNLLLERIMIYT